MRETSQALRRLNYLIGETEAVYRRAASSLGLSDSGMKVLYAVCETEEGDRCPLREICRRSGVSKQTINSALRRLEAEGLARLEQSGGRGKTVCLTEAGRALAERTVLRLMAAEEAVLAAWPPADTARYLELTERYLTALRAGTRDLKPEGREDP